MSSQPARLTSADFVIEIPGPSLACLLRDCVNCNSAKCTHDCDQHRSTCGGLTEAQVDHFVRAPCGRLDAHGEHPLRIS